MDIQKLLETTEQILILRGGPTSGNWAHDGRPGKKGGSGRGGGFKRLRLAKGTNSRQDVKIISRRVRRKRKQLKDKGLPPRGRPLTKPGEKKKDVLIKTKPGTGKKVSEGLNLSKVPQKGQIGPPIRNTINIINKVHSDGDLPQIPIRIGGGKSGNLGHYKYNGLYGTPIEIMVRRNHDSPHNTTAHEIGHFLDGQAWGRKGTPGFGRTEKDERVVEKYRNIHKVMGESSAIKTLKTDVPKQTYEVDFGDTKRTYNADRRYINYLLKPNEQFARAYAQYIATKSGDPQMKKELDDMRSVKKGRINYHDQWSDDDFKPIAKGFDDLFSELGWIEAE